MRSRAPLAAVIVSGVLVVSAALYLAAYWWLPGDGTVIDVLAPREPGLVVRVIRPGGALQTGDRVMAVDGQPLDDWLAQHLRQPWRAPAAVDSLDYTIVRAGQTLTVRQPLGPSPLAAVLGENWSTVAYLIYLELIGLIVFLRRPQLPVARRLLLLASTIVTSSVTFFLGLPLSGLRQGWFGWLWLWGTIVVFVFLAGTGLHFTMTFPRELPSPRWRWLGLGLAHAAAWSSFLANVLVAWPQPASASARLVLLMRASSAMSVVVFPLAVLGAAINYRLTRREAERRQVRWIMWGVAVAILPWVVLTALPQALGLPSLLPPLMVGLLWCALPTAFALAILREGLFDIDVIINRSLVYGTLTVVLALAYFGGVVVLQSVFSALTGEQTSQLPTVLSTIAIAALFSPLRRSLQRSVDRRFYRRKYDAARTLAAFGTSMRDEVDLAVLSERLVGAVQDTMQPAHTWLWLRPGEADPVAELRAAAAPRGRLP